MASQPASGDERPELSIVIPTKNRQATALEAIQSCLLGSGDFEVIVQDCSDTRDLESSLRHHVSDARVRYEHTGRPVSMTENWNAAMQRVRGEYVIVIGDDDAVTGDLFAAVRWARAHEIDSLAFSPFRYFWPDFPGRFSAQLLVYRCTGSLQRFDVAKELERASRASGELVKRLPKLYHGLIRRTALERLRERTGTFFDSLTPDYYIRYALAECVSAHWRLDHPLTTVGCSASSNTGREIRGEIQLHYAEFPDLDWPSMLPRISRLSSDVTLTHSMLRAFARTGRKDLAANVNLAAVYASCIQREPRRIGPLTLQYTGSVRRLGRPVSGAMARLALHLARESARILPFRGPKMHTPTRALTCVLPADGILAANRERDAYLVGKGIHFSRVMDAAESQFEGARAAARRMTA